MEEIELSFASDLQDSENHVINMDQSNHHIVQTRAINIERSDVDHFSVNVRGHGCVNVQVSSWKYVCVVVSSRFCSNSEASASDILQNLEEIFPRYLYH